MDSEINKNYWNDWGINYSQVWQNKAKQVLSNKELNFINKYINLQSPQKILDIGVGNGRILENIIANSKEGAEIYGVDISENMINICRQKFKEEVTVKRLEVCDVSQKDICFDDKFDLITVIRVLKYNRNWVEILDRIYKKLNKGGTCIFSMPNNHSIAGLKKDIFSQNKIAINYTNKKQLNTILSSMKYKSFEAVGFSKIPNIFYDFSNNNIYVTLLLWGEKFLEKIFGKSLFARYLFIICKK